MIKTIYFYFSDIQFPYLLIYSTKSFEDCLKEFFMFSLTNYVFINWDNTHTSERHYGNSIHEYVWSI